MKTTILFLILFIVSCGASNDSITPRTNINTPKKKDVTQTKTVNSNLLFSEGGDKIDFNTIKVLDYADLHNFKGGDDNVKLPFINLSIINRLNITDMVFNAGKGNDTVHLGPDNYTVNFDEGDDTVLISSGGESFLNGGLGSDMIDTATISGAVSVDLITGLLTKGALVDTIKGFENISSGLGNDILSGDDNANRILSWAGDDTISSLGGDDYIEAGSGKNIIDGGFGNDTLAYAHETKNLIVNLNATGVEQDTGASFDTISNIENLTGGFGDDILIGDMKANTLFGGDGGNDILEGGAGKDTFIIDLATILDTLVISDLELGETIILKNLADCNEDGVIDLDDAECELAVDIITGLPNSDKDITLTGITFVSALDFVSKYTVKFIKLGSNEILPK